MNRIIVISIQNPTLFIFFFTFIFPISILSVAIDNISTTQFFRDGDTLVSSGGSFELGFFCPSKAGKNKYVGIWYRKLSVRTVVWVANRGTPLTNTSGVLRVIQPGILALSINETNRIIWLTNTTRTSSQNPVAELLDSGNLVVKESGDHQNLLWQSFDYPGDTLLPGMKHGVDLVTGLDRCLRSWRSNDDPSLGDFTFGYERQGYPQLIQRKNSVEQFRSGPWNGLGFNGLESLENNSIFRFEFVFNEKEVYFMYDNENSSTISRVRLNSEGVLYKLIWVDRTKTWEPYMTTLQRGTCDIYKHCGANGICSAKISPSCQCLDKFLPKYPNQWENADWSSGCVRRTPLNCKTDGFIKYSAIKLPDTRNSWFNRELSHNECEAVCSMNCSCTAYTSIDIRNGGSGCLIWFGSLLDIRRTSQSGQDIYIRMAAPELEQSGSTKKKRYIITVSLPVVLGTFLLVFSLCLCAQRKKSGPNREGRQKPKIQDYINEGQKEDLDLPLFGLSTIAKATNNFSVDNKLGEGGFGAVYKGVFEEGKEIAVKRLSKTSRQGLGEFKNEVICIAKLQHRNLVKLLGCCIEEEEIMLIYEYMPNKSLDFFIHDETRRSLLDWPRRFNIINGIARGLLYLHQDSRLRIIHRDLKAGNVLLDADMNAKISDFGLARSFAENETQAHTKRVVGTYGYISPEYAIDGLFSLKSDVFSFGVLVLEIVSGKKNRGFFHQDHHHNLLGHAWRLFFEDKSIELMDETLCDSCCPNEVLRSVHVGLLCVQELLEERPSMSSVVLMLGGEGTLPLPKQPGFFTGRSIISDNSRRLNSPSSKNEITITVSDGR